MYTNDAYRQADDIIARLAQTGRDYSAGRDEIARVYDEDIWQGNWDSTTDFDDPNLPDLRIIQEDEYDQSMDDDEKPAWDDMLVSAGDYVFEA